jgi:hypothetical protein
MAVHIKLIKNNIKSSSSYGKYFAKAVSQGEVTLDEIAAEALDVFATKYWAQCTLCRVWTVLSQQVRENMAQFLGMRQESP